MTSECLLLGAIALGAWLRLRGIASEIPGDDEWHAIRVATQGGWSDALLSFGLEDHCIPLTIWDKVLLGTVGLGEIGLRLPVLAAGLLALVVLPLLVRGIAGRRVAVNFAWLLAVSPLEIYFTRNARPYAISGLLAAIAVLTVREGAWDPPRRSWNGIYVSSAAFATWFHLTVLPFVLSPVLAYLGREAMRGRFLQALRRLLPTATFLALALLILLAPPLLHDPAAVLMKSGQGGPITRRTVEGVATLLGGASQPIALVLLALGAVTGAILFRRRHPGPFAVFAAGITLQISALLVSRPLFVENPIVAARYLFVLLPLLLLFVAVAVAAAEASWLERLSTRLPKGSGGAACALILLVIGPLRGIPRTTNWSNSALFQFQYAPDARAEYGRDVLAPEIPAYYGELRRFPEDTLLVVEVPWRYEWQQNPYPLYQMFHRQRMLVGLVDGDEGAGGVHISDPRLHLRHFVFVRDLAELRRRGVDFVIFHKNLAHELSQLHLRPIIPVDEWIERYRRWVGEPVWEDRQVAVFAIDAGRKP
jgi:hypothetical protein